MSVTRSGKGGAIYRSWPANTLGRQEPIKVAAGMNGSAGGITNSISFYEGPQWKVGGGNGEVGDSKDQEANEKRHQIATSLYPQEF